jgi:hypothetical protein
MACARMRALENAGMINAAKMAMIAITTSSSISVNPIRRVLLAPVGIFQGLTGFPHSYIEPAISSKWIYARFLHGFRDCHGNQLPPA